MLGQDPRLQYQSHRLFRQGRLDALVQLLFVDQSEMMTLVSNSQTKPRPPKHATVVVLRHQNMLRKAANYRLDTRARHDE